MSKITEKIGVVIVNTIVALFYIIASIIGITIGISVLNWVIGW